MKKGEIKLIELIEHMQESNRLGIYCHLEGKGDGSIEIVYDSILCISKE